MSKIGSKVLVVAAVISLALTVGASVPAANAAVGRPAKPNAVRAAKADARSAKDAQTAPAKAAKKPNPANQTVAPTTKPPPSPADEARNYIRDFNFEALRLAITDLSDTFAGKYPKAKEFLSRLDDLKKAAEGFSAPEKDPKAPPASGGQAGTSGDDLMKLAGSLKKLQEDALLANPLLDFDKLLVIKRKGHLGLPQNWQDNTALPKKGFDNEIAVLSPLRPGGELKALYRPEGDRFVGDVDLNFDADKLLFSMPDAGGTWQVYEIRSDGTALRQVTHSGMSDVHSFDAAYLPSGKIVFCSTACFHGVPCVGGGNLVSLLYLMDADGNNVRQLTFDQDHSWNPAVLNSGRVLYTRWEYSDTPHYFSRLLFAMNPDGTGQMEYNGSNSYWPNSTFYARAIPGHPSKVVAIISGHHGVPRMGELMIFDADKGQREADGAVQRIPGYGKKVEPIIADSLVNNSWPKFLHPYPLGDPSTSLGAGKYFLAACQRNAASQWAIYLVDVFDNMVEICGSKDYALLEPVPLRKTPRPPVIPDKVDLKRKDAVVYLSDVYAGDGLKGVPRGSVKNLRVYAFHFAYPGMGGHIHIGIDGPWDVHRILGTVPVQEDGSAVFHVPSNTPIAVQPLDAEGNALQVMRSWFTAMPGEGLSCVGCHERQSAAPPNRKSLAYLAPPAEIKPWYGPTRGFSFKREVQPVLDTYCVSCHNGQRRPDGKSIPDFRLNQPRAVDCKPLFCLLGQAWSGRISGPVSQGIVATGLAVKQIAESKTGFPPSYAALHPYVRRPGPESDYHMMPPAEYLADTSELIQMLKKGHHNVEMNAEAWDRILTWIDLNVPCHGTWSEHRRISGNGQERRQELRKLYAGLDEDPEAIVETITSLGSPVIPRPEPPVDARVVECPGWPFAAAEAQRRQKEAAAGGQVERTVDLGGGLTMKLELIPSGEFVMGDEKAPVDERPSCRVRIDKPFWMGKFEVANEEYKLFDPEHDSRYISVYNKDQSNRGEAANNPRQPVIRISWQQAMAFCRWLSAKTGEDFTLPTEAQWEYACRAGTATPLYYGECDTDFGKFANMADQRLNALTRRDSPRWIPAVLGVNDGSIVTDNVGKYQPNAWGLNDMHGNVAEWTLTTYMPYPYNSADGRDKGAPDGRKVVRGGSFYDRPARCRSAFRLSYPTWQGVYSVGFRVVCQAKDKPVVAVKPVKP